MVTYYHSTICSSIQIDKPVKDLHADNSLVSFATDRISSTSCVTAKQHHKSFLSINLKIIEEYFF